MRLHFQRVCSKSSYITSNNASQTSGANNHFAIIIVKWNKCAFEGVDLDPNSKTIPMDMEYDDNYILVIRRQNEIITSTLTRVMSLQHKNLYQIIHQYIHS